MIRGDSFHKKISALVIGSWLLTFGALAFTASAIADLRTQVIKVCRKEATNAKKKSGGVRTALCGSAKDYMNASNSHSAGGMVMSGVAVVCTASCVNKLQSPVCNGANLGGAAATGLIEKNFINSLTPLANTLGGKLKGADKTAGTAEVGTSTTPDPAAAGTAAQAGAQPAGMNVDACKTAAIAAKGSYDKHSSATAEEKKIDEMQVNAEKLSETAGKPEVTIGAGSVNTNTAEMRAATAEVIPGEDDHCSAAKLRTAMGALNCAVRTNADLPAGVGTQEFLRDLEKATGRPADQFFANYRDPGTAILGGAAPSLSGAQQRGLASSLREMNAASGGSKNGSAFAESRVGGGRRAGGSEEAEFDMNGALNQMMAGLAGGGESQPTAPTGVLTTGFSARHPAQIGAEISPEDRSFSIFDRVKLRYSAVQKKQNFGERE